MKSAIITIAISAVAIGGVLAGSSEEATSPLMRKRTQKNHHSNNVISGIKSEEEYDPFLGYSPEDEARQQEERRHLQSMDTAVTWSGFLTTIEDELPPGSYGLCQGDCDSDEDCIGDDLFCFQRDEFEAVPGCEGEGEEGSDYCYKKPTPSPTPSPTTPVTEQTTTATATTTSATTSAPQPTPSPTPEATESGTELTAAASNELTTIGDELPEGSYGLCQGDCDSDADCDGEDLKCFQRDGFEAVPGCEGEGEEDSDYCYKPSQQQVVGGATGADNGASSFVGSSTLMMVGAVGVWANLN